VISTLSQMTLVNLFCKLIKYYNCQGSPPSEDSGELSAFGHMWQVV
jgi:hypothetical protein